MAGLTPVARAGPGRVRPGPGHQAPVAPVPGRRRRRGDAPRAGRGRQPGRRVRRRRRCLALPRACTPPASPGSCTQLRAHHRGHHLPERPGHPAPGRRRPGQHPPPLASAARWGWPDTQGLLSIATAARDLGVPRAAGAGRAGRPVGPHRHLLRAPLPATSRATSASTRSPTSRASCGPSTPGSRAWPPSTASTASCPGGVRRSSPPCPPTTAATSTGWPSPTGGPLYVTALGRTDEADGWRDGKAGGGVVIDVPVGRGRGVGPVDAPLAPLRRRPPLAVRLGPRSGGAWPIPTTGEVEVVAELPGFTRGLAFAGRYAFVGLSQVREHVFAGLPLGDRLPERQCGVWAIDTTTGADARLRPLRGGGAGDLRRPDPPGCHLPGAGRARGRAGRDGHPAAPRGHGRAGRELRPAGA